MDELNEFGDGIDDVRQSLGTAGDMARAFSSEMSRMRETVSDTGREVRVLSSGITSGLRKSFEGLIFDGDSLATAMRGVAQSMVDAAYNAAVRPVYSHFGGMLGRGVESFIQGFSVFENGGAFSQGRVMPFARGGVVSSPIQFPMRGGQGLMGEAGPEAIIPLARGADGRLGVKSEGGARPVTVVMNITTPDVAGFKRSQSQIAAQMGRVLSRGQRNR